MGTVEAKIIAAFSCVAIAITLGQQRTSPGARTYYTSPIGYTGKDFVNQTWDPKADKPFLALRAEADVLWKQYRNGDRKGVLRQMCKKAVAEWQAAPSVTKLYRAYSLGHLAYCHSDGKFTPELALAWGKTKGLNSLEFARIVYLYERGPLIDTAWSHRIGRDALKKGGLDDEPLLFRYCEDITNAGLVQEAKRLLPFMKTKLEAAYNDPFWAGAAARVYLNAYDVKNLDETRKNTTVGWQLMTRLEHLTGGGRVVMSSKLLQKNWSKYSPKDKPFSTMPWTFGPNAKKKGS